MIFKRGGNKYRAVKIDGFDSRAERDRYNELCLLERAGKIKNLQRQIPFELIPSQKEKKERPVKFIADFVYYENDSPVVEDKKGFKTKDYIIKRKLFKFLFPNYIFRET